MYLCVCLSVCASVVALTPRSPSQLGLPEHDQDLPAKTARQRHVLWAGTRVLQVRGERTAALVLRSGYGTVRGRLIASMQLPQPVAYSFYKYASIACYE